MFASLDRMDAVAEPEEGPKRCVQTDHRGAAEIAEIAELSTVFALARVLDPRRWLKPDPEVIYYLPSMPPRFLVEAVASAGGRVFVGETPAEWEDVTDEAGGSRPRPPEQLVNEAMASLARRTAAEAGLRLDKEGLAHYEQTQLDDEEIDIDFDEEEEEDDEEEDEDGEKRDADGGEARWTKIVKLASYAGEILRQHVEGRWIVNLETDMTTALLFECTVGNKTFVVNLIGKGLKFSRAGMEDSLNFLVSTVLAMTKAE